MTGLPALGATFDPALIAKHLRDGPRYTSYPTADRFVEAFDADSYGEHLSTRRFGARVRPWSLYVHVPFCATVCFYCGCNKIITRNTGRAMTYVDYVLREIKMRAAQLDDDRSAVQMHWGGGTPTFLPPEDMARLMAALRREFNFAEDAEVAIEIDPRTVDGARVHELAALGFNRMSLGVQDFDPQVQKAVNRIQTEEQTLEVIHAARAAGFRSINIDLIYGLPLQTVPGFERTLERVVAASPDRIALYSYAHIPDVFKTQRQIDAAQLPAPETKLQLLSLAVRYLTANGYRYIGMDHFAKPDDSLAVAQRQGRLQRNFQGYSTHADCDILAFGVSGIGAIGCSYYQNHRQLPEYYGAIDRGILPIMRGIEMSADDLVRRTVIHALMCNFTLSMQAVEEAYLMDFERYFAEELQELQGLAEDGLVEIQDRWITVTPLGRFLVRNVCMVFDRHLRDRERRARYSKVI